MNCHVLNTLPVAPDLECLVPFGALAIGEERSVLITLRATGFAPGRIVVIDDVPALRAAYQFIREGIVLRSFTSGPGNREFFNGWLDFVFGQPKQVAQMGQQWFGQVRWYGEQAIIVHLDDSITIAVKDSKQLRQLLAEFPSYRPWLAPARYSYEMISTQPAMGDFVGRFGQISSFCSEDFKLYESEEGIRIQGLTEDRLPTELLVRSGGRCATGPLHPGSRTQAAEWGEWQPGLANQTALLADLEKHGAPASLIQPVLAANTAIGGFRGPEGSELLAPLAAGRIHARRGNASPAHPTEEAWLIGWAMIDQTQAMIYVDEQGVVWSAWSDPAADEWVTRRVGLDSQSWFARHLFLRAHGYASDFTCREVTSVPATAIRCEQHSDTVAQVFLDESGRRVWLVEEARIQQMSQSAGSASEVIRAVERYLTG